MQYTKEQLLEKYRNLPEDVKDAMFSVDTADIIQRIGKENNLNTEKTGILADEIGLLMLGVTPPSEFINNLQKRLGAERNLVQTISHAANERIFQKIRDSLRKIQGGAETNKIPKEKKEETEEEIKIPQMIHPAGKVAEAELEPTEPQAKNIIEERTKQEVFISKPKISEKNETKYQSSIDPYREPLN